MDKWQYLEPVLIVMTVTVVLMALVVEVRDAVNISWHIGQPPTTKDDLAQEYQLSSYHPHISSIMKYKYL